MVGRVQGVVEVLGHRTGVRAGLELAQTVGQVGVEPCAEGVGTVELVGFIHLPYVGVGVDAHEARAVGAEVAVAHAFGLLGGLAEDPALEVLDGRFGTGVVAAGDGVLCSEGEGVGDVGGVGVHKARAHDTIRGVLVLAILLGAQEHAVLYVDQAVGGQTFKLFARGDDLVESRLTDGLDKALRRDVLAGVVAAQVGRLEHHRRLSGGDGGDVFDHRALFPLGVGCAYADEGQEQREVVA